MNSPHSLCERHARKNIKRHVEKEQTVVPAALSTHIGCLIYGAEDGSADAVTDHRTRFAGLADSADETFDDNLALFLDKLRKLGVSKGIDGS